MTLIKNKTANKNLEKHLDHHFANNNQKIYQLKNT